MTASLDRLAVRPCVACDSSRLPGRLRDSHCRGARRALVRRRAAAFVGQLDPDRACDRRRPRHHAGRQQRQAGHPERVTAPQPLARHVLYAHAVLRLLPRVALRRLARRGALPVAVLGGRPAPRAAAARPDDSGRQPDLQRHQRHQAGPAPQRARDPGQFEAALGHKRAISPASSSRRDLKRIVAFYRDRGYPGCQGDVLRREVEPAAGRRRHHRRPSTKGSRSSVAARSTYRGVRRAAAEAPLRSLKIGCRSRRGSRSIGRSRRRAAKRRSTSCATTDIPTRR